VQGRAAPRRAPRPHNPARFGPRAVPTKSIPIPGPDRFKLSRLGADPFGPSAGSGCRAKSSHGLRVMVSESRTMSLDAVWAAGSGFRSSGFTENPRRLRRRDPAPGSWGPVPTGVQKPDRPGRERPESGTSVPPRPGQESWHGTSCLDAGWAGAGTVARSLRGAARGWRRAGACRWRSEGRSRW
jgi:hypothetical protein